MPEVTFKSMVLFTTKTIAYINLKKNSIIATNYNSLKRKKGVARKRYFRLVLKLDLETFGARSV